MNILTLDLGTTFGWAFDNGEIQSGSHSLKTARHEGAGMRFLRFEQWLERFASEKGYPTVVYFEEVRRHNSVQAAHVYGGFKTALMSWCERWRIPYQSVPVGTIKKHFTGNGAAKKKAMMCAAITHYGIIPDDDNHADALGILAYAQDVLHRL